MELLQDTVKSPTQSDPAIVAMVDAKRTTEIKNGRLVIRIPAVEAAGPICGVCVCECVACIGGCFPCVVGCIMTA